MTAATVGATTAWTNYGLTGKGIGIAVIDSGVGSHSDFVDSAAKNHVVYST